MSLSLTNMRTVGAGTLYKRHNGIWTPIGAASVSLAPSSGSVANGNNLVVRVNVDSYTNNHETVQVRLTYDPSKFSYQSHDASASNYNTGGVDETGTGYVQIVRGNTSPLTGSQVFVDVTFQALVGTGTGEIGIDSANTHVVYAGTGLEETGSGGSYTFTA